MNVIRVDLLVHNGEGLRKYGRMGGISRSGARESRKASEYVDLGKSDYTVLE